MPVAGARRLFVKQLFLSTVISPETFPCSGYLNWWIAPLSGATNLSIRITD
jgi:hypothetical protein